MFSVEEKRVAEGLNLGEHQLYLFDYPIGTSATF